MQTDTKKYRRPPRTREDLEPETLRIYATRVAQYVEHSDRRHPEDMGVAEINAFLTFLSEVHHVGAITQNQARAAIVWTYRHVLGRDIEAEGDIIRAKRPQHLPTIHRHETVMKVLGLLDGHYRLIGALMYGSGLSPAEALRIRVEDVALDPPDLSVRNRSGIVARHVIIAEVLIEPLRQHIDQLQRRHRIDCAEGFGHVRTPSRKMISDDLALQWLFPASRRYLDKPSGQHLRHHLHPTALQKALRRASRFADLAVPVMGRHLRPACAVQLVEDGYSIRTVQEAIGHRSVRSTMTLTRAAGHNIRGVVSPADTLPKPISQSRQ